MRRRFHVFTYGFQIKVPRPTLPSAAQVKAVVNAHRFFRNIQNDLSGLPITCGRSNAVVVAVFQIVESQWAFDIIIHPHPNRCRITCDTHYDLLCGTDVTISACVADQAVPMGQVINDIAN